MTVEQEVLEKLKTLPPDRKREVLEFAEFLSSRVTVGVRNRVNGALTELNENELTHLESEFKDYDRLYPRR